MLVVPPLGINAMNLTSSSLAALLAPAAYSGGTTYALGDIRKDSFNNVYQSLQNSNLNNAPNLSPLYWQQIGVNEVAWAGGTYAIGDYSSYLGRNYVSLTAHTNKNPLLSPTDWEDIGPTNQLAMFDLNRDTASVSGSPLTVVITPGARIDTIGIVGIVADTIRVQMTSGGNSVYDQTQMLSSTSYIGDWYTYFFARFFQKDEAIFQNIPPYSNGIVTITFAKATGNCEVGAVVMGTAVDLGAIQYGADDDALNFSSIDRSFDGEAELVPRRTVPQTNQTTWLDLSKLSSVRIVRQALAGYAALWVGLADSTNPYFDSFILCGVYKKFGINATFTDKAVLTLELEGL